MAKVKDQVLPGSDVSYIDSQGVVHYDADLIRHIMPNAYPLPSLNPTGVAKKTARNKRPPEQGEGSPTQKPQRQCFRNCANMWHTLPTTCPTEPQCFGLPSMENVWAQKEEQGVMCSYYDLFMSCCMSQCQDDGSIASGDLDCWDCPTIEAPPCSPGFTSEGMGVGESQDLGCVVSDPCCDCDKCVLILTGGGGELVDNEDGTWTYTAPDTNENCDNNPTFALCCDGYECVELDIAVNAFDDGSKWAVLQWVITGCTGPSLGYYSLNYIIYIYNCDGGQIWEMPNNEWGESCAEAEAKAIAIFGGDAGTFIDKREAAWIEAGCCPPQLV